jgi:flagellar motility protein MotE (MotC chaperone)
MTNGHLRSRLVKAGLARVRFLPAAIFVASLTLTVRLGDIWSGVDGAVTGAVKVSSARAQTGEAPTRLVPPKAEAQPAGQPAGQPSPAAPPPAPAAAGGAPAADAKEAAKPGAGKAAREDAAQRLLVGDPTFLTPAEIDILQRLAARRDVIEAREKEIESRASLLRAAEARIDKKIQELKSLESTIGKLLKQYQDQQNQKMDSLVKVYENMKPKEAARILEELDLDTLLLLAERMGERKLAPIMAKMNPERAKEITSELARLRELPPPGSTPGG